MDCKLMELSIFLEELKMKRDQVAQLDLELSRLNLGLIEKESELHAKTAYCRQLELKLAKSNQEIKKMNDDFGALTKSHQQETSRQEAAILDYAEKLRKVQMEKQCLTLKSSHFEKEIKEVYGHVRTVVNGLPKLHSQLESLAECLQALENKQLKLIETCEMIQVYASRIQKEAEGKWKIARESRANQNELEKKLCATEAQLRTVEGDLGKSDTAGLLRKQKESLSHQLEMSKQREDKLRLDLGREREEKLDLQRKHEQLLFNLQPPCICFVASATLNRAFLHEEERWSMFVGQMPNVTVSTGREAVFTCIIDNVYNFKVAFLRVDTQTILAIDDTVITRSARVTVRHSIDKDERLSTGQRKTWQLYLKDVTPSDAGGYMCQLNNFEPMVSQVAYLHVTVPPDILVNESSSDLTIKEGGNATLKCSAIGYPEPNITWRREDYQPIDMNQSVGVVEGSILNLVGVHRRQMAAYLCIASNGIPPPVR
ncbi:hypothetical protein GHT06_019734 [Daphnia sinensis]|uniref:Ig-like domain-containing protein n=1 Tax=Daphnia sinensis TaxID=1820382 RepID=A0AAD5PNW4_9CRUS|nr:hypothetical protein GHT06_019734 [Daphnia sinensis]